MSVQPLRATIRGIPENPAITEINIRSGPATSFLALFRAPVGQANLTVLEARPDALRGNFQGKTYQWLRLAFPDGREGWARDDLLMVQGDGRMFGYPVLTQPTFAFALRRDESVRPLQPGEQITPPGWPGAPPPTPPTPPAPKPPVNPTPPNLPPTDPERVRRAAFNITAAFEGSGYAAYQNIDSGIISYGRFQFTLSSGSLGTLINRYLDRSSSQNAAMLREYFPRIAARDGSLRRDERLRTLLIQAAAEPIMQQLQDEAAEEGYYRPVFELSINPRGIVTPLGQALLFDMAIQHGRFNHLVPKTEEVLGVPNKSRLGENGVTEAQFMQTLTRLRKENLYALASRLNLPGLRSRGDFWVDLVARGDWNLQGDANGEVNVNGRRVQVRQP